MSRITLDRGPSSSTSTYVMDDHGNDPARLGGVLGITAVLHTFNTHKNRGYHLEHNFGHGENPAAGPRRAHRELLCRHCAG